MTPEPDLRIRTQRPSLAAVQEKASELLTATMRVEIVPRLGWVTVTACGVVDKIWYDPAEVRFVHVEHIARATTAAIIEAETRAAQWQEREFREIGSFIRWPHLR